MSEAFPDPRTLLRRHGLNAKKSWGQNFLVSERAYRAIVDATVSSDDDWIVEFGSGLGTLTMRLAQRVPEGRVFAVEPEKDMLSVLRAELGELEDVEIIEDSALSYDLGPVARWRGDKLTVCGNLPYNVASQIILRVIENREHVSRGVFMIQREMADRLLASPGTKAYGALGVMVTTYADVKQVIRVGPGAFVPPPKVESTVIRIDPLESARASIDDPKRYRHVVRAAFGQRRKTLRNALRARFEVERVDAALSVASIDGKRRGETLTIAEFASLANAFGAAEPEPRGDA